MVALSTLLAIAGCQGVGGISGEAYSGRTSLPEIRSSNGLQPLAADPALEQAALDQAKLMVRAGKMNHTTGIGRSFASRMSDYETNGGAAENIAYGAFGTDELFRRWMNSPGHRRNMLNPTFTRYGLASAKETNGNRRYWALVLAR
jgi:uncharacterized protein YkwD